MQANYNHFRFFSSNLMLRNMALATVGGAFLSSFLNVVFDRISSPKVVDWIRGAKLDQRLLQRLETSLHVVQAVLNDAEQKQITDPAVKKWLTDLKDAVYVADDLLDEVSTKAATQKGSGNFLSQSLNLEERELVTKIEGIIDRLESIVKLKDTLRLKDFAEDNISSWRVPSTSLVEKSYIYGRDKDKEAIVELLLDDACDGEIPVISIVGIGGIGKTTLAQLVYNDDKVTGKFNFRAWVCVGEKLDVINVTKTIVQAITSDLCNMNDFDLLQTNLKKELAGKTFLIVLDDVWNDRPDMWKNLLKPFQYGNIGSKILITTRSEKIASVNPIIPPYNLSILSDEDCWSVFLKHSFLSPKSREYATLEQIGRRIVRKCKGLPLAVETLGGLLCTKCDVKDWNDILKSEIWELSEDESMIMPALRISYHHLPSHLKRCFVYCSLFSQDHKFDKDELILLWMAEDFLQLMGRKTLEEIGCGYFNELVARLFFQPDRAIFGDRVFVMHDLMHDLATFCAGEFYFRAEEHGSATEIGCKTRHLSCNVRGDSSISKLLIACQGAKHMRTFVGENLGEFDVEVISQLKFLRVLSFQSFHSLDSLPDSIGGLIHLRYLNLSYTYIVTLPESLSKLYNLQTLKLNGCKKLGMLPSGMQDLVNLRHLDIRETCLKEMPNAMSNLKHLQFLSNYVVGKHEENKIRELGPLTTLHRSLDISNLENLVNSDEALESRIIDKKYINSLVLSWSSNSSVADSRMERDILDKLQPHSNLKELSINGYRGTMLSDWLGHSSYKNMTNLTLNGCGNCWKLPSLGQLPSLKHLEISHFDMLLCIDAEFYKSDESCSETPFRSLETLIFDRLDCWQEWNSLEFDDAFPQLKNLTIDQCPKLIGDLPNHLPNLEKLTIGKGCEQLACSLPRAPAMVELTIEPKNKLRMQELPLSLSSLSIQGNQLVEFVFEAMTHTPPTCLCQLHISSCDSALSFPGDCLPSSLQDLSIGDCKKLDFPLLQHKSLRSLAISDSCDSLTSFPFHAFPNLRKLEIEGCENMKSLVVGSQSPNATISSLRSLTIDRCPKFLSFSTLGVAAPQLESLWLWRCPEIDSFPKEGLPPKLRELWINGCDKLVTCLASMDSCSQSLTRPYIGSVKAFPKESCLPSSLESLYLWSFPSLEALNCNGLFHLTSLQSLTIWNCVKLENMIGERLPAALTHLNIRCCPLLGKRCGAKDPKIWPKISHIPYIEVDRRQIL